MSRRSAGPGAAPMTHLALNVYRWGNLEQDALLTGSLGPVARELWLEGRLRRFWIHRFDARGPHVLALLGTPAEQAEAVRRRLSAGLDDYLARSPSRTVLPEIEVRQRHEACRGGTLCSLDMLDGMAPNDSYLFAEQPESVAPFRHLSRTEAADEASRLLGELAFWCIARLGDGTAPAGAVRWVAALDSALERAGADPGRLWHTYAASLFPALRERILHGDPKLAAELERRIGDGNRIVFEGVWSAARTEAPVWDGIDRLAGIAAEVDRGDPVRAFTRNLTHAVLAQLGFQVRFRIPLVLYAWLHQRP